MMKRLGWIFNLSVYHLYFRPHMYIYRHVDEYHDNSIVVVLWKKSMQETKHSPTTATMEDTKVQMVIREETKYVVGSPQTLPFQIRSKWTKSTLHTLPLSLSLFIIPSLILSLLFYSTSTSSLFSLHNSDPRVGFLVCL